MKKRMMKRLLALALTGVMTGGALAGCGEAQAPAQAPADAPAAEAPAAEEKTDEEKTAEIAETVEVAAEAGIPGYTPFAESVELRIPVYDRGAEGVPDVSDNYWTKWLQENFGDQYNIKMTFVPITRSDVMTDYSLLAAGQQLPTFLMEYDFPKQAQWAADGYLVEYDLNEFAQVAPTYYQKMVDNNQLGYTQLNGKTYFALAERPYYNTNYTWVEFVRQDWLEQVGYDHIPYTNSDEWFDAMKKIQEAGLAEHPAGGQMIDGLGSDQNYGFRTYPMNEEEWAMYGDYSIVSLGWEPNKNLLRMENKKYNLGLLDPEYYMTDGETAKANFINGKSYSYAQYIPSTVSDVVESLYALNPDAKVAVHVQETEADATSGTVPALRSNNPFGMMISFSSQASEDQIKAAWMYMEWMIQEENLFNFQWGLEGEHYKLNDKNLPESVCALTDQPVEHRQGFNYNKDYWCVAIEARNAGTIEDVIAAAVPNTDHIPAETIEQFKKDIIQTYYNQVAISEKGWVPVDCMFATTIDSVGEYQETLKDLYKTYRDEIVMTGEDNFDSLYDQRAQEYADAGYQAIADERLEALKSGMSSKLGN
ncbi:MAG: sugar ABC transporter substrate-binding protein [Lachnospiraceae bacterium]|nr:sugar ABC transporter substrate-binding protein [Lachnospiraceae bacterium]